MRRQVMIRQGCVDGFSDADPVITVFRGIPSVSYTHLTLPTTERV